MATVGISASHGGGVDVVLPDDIRGLLSSLARQLAERNVPFGNSVRFGSALGAHAKDPFP